MSDLIELEGVRVNNLKGVDINIRRNALTVICGVSGSGKSSLAFDTLFSEGQRRYVETFSPYARQFLDQVERPAAERIEGIPPAIAIRQNSRNQNARSTVGTRTEVLEYLRPLFARAGEVQCPDCHVHASHYTPDSASQRLISDYSGRRAMLVFTAGSQTPAELLQLGFVRCVTSETTQPLTSVESDSDQRPPGSTTLIVADRIRIESDAADRIAESIEQTYGVADGRCMALVAAEDEESESSSRLEIIDGKPWHRVVFSRAAICPKCEREFEPPTPESLNFQSPLGACQTCEGSGQISGMQFEKVVPDDGRSIADGAIQPWTTPAYRHELDELLALAPKHGLPVDRPFRELGEHHRRLIQDGDRDADFGGLAGFHSWLVRNRYKPGVAVVLNRWRSWLPCPECNGSRLTSAAGMLTMAEMTIHQATQLEIEDLSRKLKVAIDGMSDSLKSALSTAIGQLQSRLSFLIECGLGYLSLDRSMKSLSGGEAQRVVLTSVLGSGLINTLYVLDEPTSGLSGSDTQRVIDTCRRLTAPGNTVVVVEHDPAFIAAADEVVEIGPGAGDLGGQVVFQGPPAELSAQAANSPTADWLSRHDTTSNHSSRAARIPQKWIRFTGVECHNITGLSGEIPLEAICAVTGVSGSGKSSLIVDAVYPELCRRLGQTCARPREGSVERLEGVDHIGEVCLLDQSPLRSSRRSIPATVVGAFDEIRKVMATTHEARKRNYKAGMFSFNSSRGGRCEICEGHGIVTVEMQFLADIRTTCESCSGRRFRPDVLEVRYRDRSIDDILQMTVENAFVFFGGHRKIQQRLNALRLAGLGYIRLGQPVATLSGGEAQRLKIAALLAGVPVDSEGQPNARQSSEAGTLFLLDEPSTGLHMKDIDALMKCLNHLVDIGHSVVIIEHNFQVVSQADFEITLGPGAGRSGGQIIRSGASQIS